MPPKKTANNPRKISTPRGDRMQKAKAKAARATSTSAASSRAAALRKKTNSKLSQAAMESGPKMRNQDELLEIIQSPGFKETLLDIYIDKFKIKYLVKRYVDAVKKHKKIYGLAPCEIYSAPGRTELCGNHTDHQHGKVLAASVNLDSVAVVTPRDDSKINLYSEGYGKISVDIDHLMPNSKEHGTSEALIKGVTAWMKDHRCKIGGFDAYVTSDVAGGAGVSSSASFEVLIGNILSGLYNEMKVSPIRIAIASQYAENDYFGKPSGLMDQMACSVGGIIFIDFKYLNKPLVEKIHFDFEEHDMGLCITNTKSSHENLTDYYASIPEEMCRVAKFMGRNYLRDCSEVKFFTAFDFIRQKVGDRAILRALHYFLEERNVDNAVSALKNDDISFFFQTLKKSGDSSFKNLQNIYTDQDHSDQSLAVALAASDYLLDNDGVSRVHGGGFAGTIQAFVRLNYMGAYKDYMEQVFKSGECYTLKIRKYGGMKVL